MEVSPIRTDDWLLEIRINTDRAIEFLRKGHEEKRRLLIIEIGANDQRYNSPGGWSSRLLHATSPFVDRRLILWLSAWGKGGKLIIMPFSSLAVNSIDFSSRQAELIDGQGV